MERNLFNAIFNWLEEIEKNKFKLVPKLDLTEINQNISNIILKQNNQDSVKKISAIKTKYIQIIRNKDLCSNCTTDYIESLFPNPILYFEGEYADIYASEKLAKIEYNKEFDVYYEALLKHQAVARENVIGQLNYLITLLNKLEITDPIKRKKIVSFELIDKSKLKELEFIFNLFIKNKIIHQTTTLDNFNNLFLGKVISVKINWIIEDNQLFHFIQLLLKYKIVKEKKQKWLTTSSLFLVDGKDLYNQSFKKHSIPKKENIHIQRAINRLK